MQTIRHESLSRNDEGFELIPDLYTNVECEKYETEYGSIRKPKKQLISAEKIKMVPVKEQKKRQLPVLKEQSPPLSPPRQRKPLKTPKFFRMIRIIKQQCDLEASGTLVYRCLLPQTSDRWLASIQDISPQVPLYPSRQSRTLQFDSKFEGGNLCCVYKQSSSQYDLHIRVDTNTVGHRQWYYFSMRNKKTCTVKFNIHRFSKPQSLYQKGMSPYVFSRKSYQKQRLDWRQEGQEVKYQKKQKYWILSFSYTFEFPNDEVLFAACPPFTHSRLIRQIKLIKDTKLKINTDYTKKSLGGLEIPIITIQNQSPTVLYSIIIIARSHPGESSSSWVMKGIIDYLSSDNPSLSLFPQNLQIKLIPMVNPDGVSFGNYRTGLMGKDFNRYFASGKRNIFPQIDIVRRVVRQTKKQSSVLCFIDLHGHSIAQGSFLYGSSRMHYPSWNSFARLTEVLGVKSKIFSSSSCVFRERPMMQETARIHFQQHQKMLTYTLENSLGLYQNMFGKREPIACTDWVGLGYDLSKSLIELANHLPNQRPIFTLRQDGLTEIVSQPKPRVIIKNTIKHTINSTKFLNDSYTNHSRKHSQSVKSPSSDKNTVNIRKIVTKTKDLHATIIKLDTEEITRNSTYEDQEVVHNTFQPKDMNDSDDSEDDLPLNVWNELKQEVEAIINNQEDVQVPQLIKQSQKVIIMAQETKTPSRLPISRQPTQPPQKFREVRFDQSSKKDSRIDISNIDNLFQISKKIQKAFKTEPTIAIAQKMLNEQLSGAFAGTKLLLPQRKKTNVFNQRHVLQKIQKSLGRNIPFTTFLKR